MIPSGWFDLALDVVLSPGLWLSVLFALIYALLFSVWRWAGWRQLGRDVLAGVLGFAAGQLVGTLVGVGWGRIGQGHLLLGTVGAGVALAAGRRLWRSDGGA
jgi:hypothetical protein